MSSASQSSPNEYSPTPYLVSRSGLSRDEFLAQYEAFRSSVRHVESAPELVFERIVGNLAEAFITGFAQERTQHAHDKESWHLEKAKLQTDLVHATATTKQAVTGLPPSTLAAATSPATGTKQTYLQFWFESFIQAVSYSSEKSYTGVRAATSSTPVPYGLGSGWPAVQIMRTCTSHGSYDSRMDPLVTGATVPMTINRRIFFQNAFPTPPNVAVWLTGLSAATGAAVSVKATANNITETDFMLQISSGDGARLDSVGIAWAVWPEAAGYQSPRVTVGTVSTVTPQKGRVSTLAASGEFPQGKGGKMLLVAVCAVDLVLTGGLWVDVGADSRWMMKVGPAKAIVYSARIMYVSR
ncbi:hypothetical protein Q9L58_008519 [Maublancomyces gigas]|uniref:H-type lectin domain-containing protein n=1 Tax=Discina gigas TaxID=1032678 RepID=A0ABR3G9V4_9PEZI